MYARPMREGLAPMPGAVETLAREPDPRWLSGAHGTGRCRPDQRGRTCCQRQGDACDTGETNWHDVSSSLGSTYGPSSSFVRRRD